MLTKSATSWSRESSTVQIASPDGNSNQTKHPFEEIMADSAKLRKRGRLNDAGKKTGSKKSGARKPGIMTRSENVNEKPVSMLANVRGAGTYTTPAFSLPVPRGWNLSHSDSLEIVSPNGTLAIHISVCSQTGPAAEIDASRHLARFLAEGDVLDNALTILALPNHAIADFDDKDGKQWRVMFRSDDGILLRAACTSPSRASREAQIAHEVLQRIVVRPCADYPDGKPSQDAA